MIKVYSVVYIDGMRCQLANQSCIWGCSGCFTACRRMKIDNYHKCTFACIYRFNSTISVLLNHISRLDQVSCLSGHNTLNKNKHFCSYFSQFTHFVICYFGGLLHPPGRCATEMLIKQHTHCTGVLSQNLREISLLCAQKKS